jgi:hypothetical protein
MTMDLRIGDQVMWRGSFGSDKPTIATVTFIEIVVPPNRHGEEVDSAPWSQKDCLIVDLDNGHWARGIQLKPLNSP